MKKQTEWERYLVAETRRREREDRTREREQTRRREALDRASDEYREFMLELMVAFVTVALYLVLLFFGQLPL